MKELDELIALLEQTTSKAELRALLGDLLTKAEIRALVDRWKTVALLQLCFKPCLPIVGKLALGLCGTTTFPCESSLPHKSRRSFRGPSLSRGVVGPTSGRQDRYF